MAQHDRCILLRPTDRLLAASQERLVEIGRVALRDQKGVPKLRPTTTR